MFIPYATDAPLYHRPLGTIGLIATNILVFLYQLSNPLFTDNYKLIYGEFNPLQWLTSAFMHADLLHLVGNMIFLWIFGIIIEGKIGSLKFLGVFLLMAVCQNGVEQVLSIMFPPDSVLADLFGVRLGSLGASSAIYGLMVMAMLWAPENQIHFKFLFCYHYISEIELSVLMVGFIFVALDFFSFWMSYFVWSSAFLHLLGGLIGGGIGYWMLVTQRVDCEGFDFLSILQGRRGQRVLTKEQTIAEQQHKEEIRQARQREVKNGMARVKYYVEQGHFEMAINRFGILRRNYHGIKLPESLHVEIIQGLLQNPGSRLAAIPVMEHYIRDYSRYRISIALNLARLYLDLQQRPQSAFAIAKQLREMDLDPRQRVFLSKIIADCRQMIDDGVIETGR